MWVTQFGRFYIGRRLDISNYSFGLYVKLAVARLTLFILLKLMDGCYSFLTFTIFGGLYIGNDLYTVLTYFGTFSIVGNGGVVRDCFNVYLYTGLFGVGRVTFKGLMLLAANCSGDMR